MVVDVHSNPKIQRTNFPLILPSLPKDHRDQQVCIAQKRRRYYVTAVASPAYPEQAGHLKRGEPHEGGGNMHALSSH